MLTISTFFYRRAKERGCMGSMGSRKRWVELGNVGRAAPVGWSVSVVDHGVALLASRRPRCMGLVCQRTRGERGTG